MKYQRNKGKVCLVEHCTDAALSREMCSIHYHRMRKTGTTDPRVLQEPTEKVCSECGDCKSVSEFYKNKRHADGRPRHASVCKLCYAKVQRRYYLVSKYGITIDDYMEMLASQDFGCAICEVKENAYGQVSGRAFAVDHNHETGKVRGLLCQTCNRMLGLAGDSVERLKKSLDYLEAHR